MDSAVQTLLGSVGQLLREEYQQLRGVGGQVAELRDDVATMNALLLMHSEADEDAVDHFIQEWMKQLRELAFDSEDCIDDYRVRIKSRPENGVGARLKRLFGTLSPRRRLAAEVIVLRARATAIRERHVPYGADRKALHRSVRGSAWGSARDLFRAVDPGNQRFKDIIGNQAEAKAAEILAAGTCLHFFVGPSGIGKTTLAIEVCRRLKAEFGCQALASMSPAFDSSCSAMALPSHARREDSLQWLLFEGPLQWHIIEEGTCWQHLDEEELDTLRRALGLDFLEPIRYLIVIDNVWTALALEAVLSAIPETNNGSKIIITTQSEALARNCSIGRDASICYVQHLDGQESERMFLSRASNSKKDAFDSKKPEGSSLDGKDTKGDGLKRILEICHGVPLAIACAAGVLVSYIVEQRQEKFDRACDLVSSQMDTIHPLQRVRHIITLNYNSLPNEVKGCMMYLSIFPRGYVISKDRLLCRWIAEGLVAENQEMSMQEVAECYFHELLCRNMIEPVSIGYDGRVKRCKVHDMVLEVMVSKALETYFVALLGGQHKVMSQDRIRRLSIHDHDNNWRWDPRQISGSSMDGMKMQRVRSLSIFGQLEGHKLLDQLRKFVLLRVLDLEGCKVVTNNHVKYACQLPLLQFLSLRGTQIYKVPPEIGKLEHLQTFDVRDTYLLQMPQTITNLQNLECLLMSSPLNDMLRLPRGLQKMKALRKVKKAVLGNDIQIAKEVGELQHLQELDMCVDLSAHMQLELPEQRKQVLHEFGLSLSKLYSLRSLNIGSNPHSSHALDFLHHLLSPPRLLRRLGIHGGIESLPTWISSHTNLAEFVISDVDLNGDQVFDVLCSLRNLKSIRMQNAYIGNELVARSRHYFPSLINFEVTSGVEESPRVIQFEEGSMPNLEELDVRFADKTILGTEYLVSLKKVKLTNKKDNPAPSPVLEQLKAENQMRPSSSRSSQFKVVVSYE